MTTWGALILLAIVAAGVAGWVYLLGKVVQSILMPRRIYPNGTMTWRDDATLANRAARKRRQRARRKLRDAGVSEDEVWRRVPYGDGD